MIRADVLPQHALLRRYTDSGAYTDCYSTDIGRAVSQAQYIEAFYTTWVFKLERRLLRLFLSKPSEDLQARALAVGELDAFSAWTVEGRTADQLLMCDMHARTRSWLMSASFADDDADARTRLYFGSAVVRVLSKRSGRSEMGFAFQMLLGFHRIYSRVLLRAAVARLHRTTQG